MSQFIYPSYILSEDRKIFLLELTNSIYKKFVKTLTIGDNECFGMFVDNLLSDLFYDKSLTVNSLTNVDKLYMLICVRAYCIGSTITFNTEVPNEKEKEKKKTKAKITIDLNEVLNRLGNYDIVHSYKFEDRGITVEGALPRKLYYDNIMEVAADTLSTITTNKKAVNVYQVDLADRIKILGTLPSAILPRIIDFLQTQEQVLKNDPLIVFNTTKELPFDKQLGLQLYNGTIGEIVKILFNTNMKDLYTTEYTLMRRFKFTYSAIESCTPAELGVYYEIIHRDLEREKKEMEEQQRSGGNNLAAPPKNLAPE